MESLLLRGGVVGVHLPTLVSEVVPIHRGDMLIFATDGVRSDFLDAPLPPLESQALADYILAHWGTQTDDALVLVVRYLVCRLLLEKKNWPSGTPRRFRNMSRAAARPLFKRPAIWVGRPSATASACTTWRRSSIARCSGRSCGYERAKKARARSAPPAGSSSRASCRSSGP